MLTTEQTRAMYQAAGLPLPIYKQTSPTGQRLAYDSKIGTIVHEVLAEVAHKIRFAAPRERMRMIDAATERRLRRFTDLGRGDKSRMRVTTLAGQYVRLYLPPTEATFIGAELPAGRGRTDLAWRGADGACWFDEIKTWRAADEVLDDATLDQVSGYIDAGIDAFGDDFVGVRVLPLGNQHRACLVAPTGEVRNLLAASGRVAS